MDVIEVGDQYYILAKSSLADDRTRGVGCVHGAGRNIAGPQSGEHGFEPRELLARVGILGLVSDREVGAHTRQFELGPVDDLGGEAHRIFRGAADAVHASVDLEVHAEALPRAAVGDRLRERVDPGKRVHDRREPVRHHASGRLGNGFRQHQHGSVDPRIAFGRRGQ